MTCRRRLRLALATIVVAVLLVADRCLFDGIGALLSFRSSSSSSCSSPS